MEEQELSLIEKLAEKFTKANMYCVLLDLNKEDTELTLDQVIAAVKPQKGGGTSANPAKEIDGVMNHWCRLKNEYRPESEFVLSEGKTKGATALASKVAYRIQKAAAEINAEAMDLFKAGKYEEANGVLAGEQELLDMIEDPATFTDEAMEISIYHPDYKKKKETTISEEL